MGHSHREDRALCEGNGLWQEDREVLGERHVFLGAALSEAGNAITRLEASDVLAYHLDLACDVVAKDRGKRDELEYFWTQLLDGMVDGVDGESAISDDDLVVRRRGIRRRSYLERCACGSEVESSVCSHCGSMVEIR